MIKRKKYLLLAVVISVAVAFTALMPFTAYAKAEDTPPQPDWLPPELEVTPYSQTVNSPDDYRAEWQACIYEGTGHYTLETWFGEGSYYRRTGLSGGGSCYPYNFHYDHVSTGWYYQTWKISGQGGPDNDYTQVYRSGS